MVGEAAGAIAIVNISFEDVYTAVFNFLHTNLLISAVLALLLLYLLFRKPKIFLVLLLIVTVVSAVFYLISQISSDSVTTKDSMIKVKELPR